MFKANGARSGRVKQGQTGFGGWQVNFWAGCLAGGSSLEMIELLSSKEGIVVTAPSLKFQPYRDQPYR